MPYGADPFPIFVPALATITQIVSFSGSNSGVSGARTAFPHTFIAGEYVRFIIPPEYGMTQLNNVVALITLIPFNPAGAETFIFAVDTNSFDPFVVPVVQEQFAQAVPVGEVALQLTGATRNVLPYP